MKEDDMDEMMRKAAENYEVDAGKAADWNAVYNAVHLQNDDLPPGTEEKKKKRRFMFWWLLLIPLGWIANTEYNRYQNNTIKQAGKIKVEEKLTGTVPKQTDAVDQLKKNNIAPGNNTEINDADNKPTITTGKAANNSSVPAFLQQQTGITEASRNLQANKDITGNKPPPLTDAANIQQPAINTTIPTQSNSVNNLNNGETTPVDNNVNNAAASPLSNNSTLPAPAKQNNLAPDNNKQLKPTVAKQPSLRKISKSNRYFYAGLMAGADLSFVKYQDVQPLGYNAGLLVGYKFKKLSIESGFYFDKKNYYTSGEHFDKSDLPYFDYAEILTVDGYCNMFEIPLNVKYDFSTRKKHTWFAAAGLSSYLMNKEYYNYEYIKYDELHHGSSEYKKSTQDWFSVLNLSAGYELKTGNKTNIRIEPYYKLSLTGVGTGNLSISSMGVNAGIVRQIP